MINVHVSTVMQDGKIRLIHLLAQLLNFKRNNFSRMIGQVGLAEMWSKGHEQFVDSNVVPQSIQSLATKVIGSVQVERVVVLVMEIGARAVLIPVEVTAWNANRATT